MARSNILIKPRTGPYTTSISWAISFDASDHQAVNCKVQKKNLIQLSNFWVGTKNYIWLFDIVSDVRNVETITQEGYFCYSSFCSTYACNLFFFFFFISSLIEKSDNM